MKNLILSLFLFVSVICWADEPTELYMPNDAGGYIVLTKEMCSNDQAIKDYPYRAYGTESSEAVLHEGCWSTPDTTSVPTQLLSKSEGAPEAPTINVLSMVNTWWGNGIRATYRQSNFSKEKKRW